MKPQWVIRFYKKWGFFPIAGAGGKTRIEAPAPPPVPVASPEELELQRLQLQFFKEQSPLQLELQRKQLQFFTEGLPGVAEAQRQQLQFFAETLPGVTEAQKAQTELLRSLIEPTKQFAEERSALISPLLRGELPPGVFSRLGRPIGTEEQSFQRGRERILASLAEAGLLSSGVRAELETELCAQIAAASEAQERADLANLLNVALGGAGQAVGEAGAIGGAPIQTALGGVPAIQTGLGGLGNIQAGIGAGQGALGGVQSTAQRIADFNRSIFNAQLEASAREQAARMAMYGQLFQAVGQVGGQVGAAALGGAKSSIRYKKNIKLWVKPLNYSSN